MKTKLITTFSSILVVLSIMLPSLVFGEAETPLFEDSRLLIEFSIPGRIEGIGTYFEIKNSEYLNISLKSSEEIKVILESIPRMISLNIEADPDGINSTVLTLEGLEPNKNYYKYQDSYKNEAVFVSSENGSYSWTQDLTNFYHIWFQEEKGTIFLPEQCENYGGWDGETRICALNQDLTESVEIGENNIILDCNGHKITGNRTGSGYGIYLNNKEGVTLKNCNISNKSFGILLFSSNNNTLTDNTASNNGFGICLESSNNNTLTGNTISNSFLGICLEFSSNNTLTDNTASNNSYGGIYLSSYLKSAAPIYSNNNTLTGNTISNSLIGISLHYSSNNILRNNLMLGNEYNFYTFGRFDNDIDTSNFVDGKPIYYLIGASNIVIDSSLNAGTVYCIECDNITIKDLNLTNNAYGIFFYNTKDSKIQNNRLSNNSFGILLFSSNNNTLTDNTASNNYDGIYLESSSSNTLTGNAATSNYYCGIYLSSSGNNTLTGNAATSNYYHGINLFYSNNNTLTGNTATSNHYCGILLTYSNGNRIYNNNFINNLRQANVYGGSGNLFDNGYPSGGNYWSNYTGVDLYSGSNQNEEGSDGIGDTPYTFTGGRDNYPFMEESGWEAPPVPTYNVAVILAETSDVPHESSPITEQPCKLIPKKTYPNGRDKEYYQDLTYCVADYHKENSFGRVNLKFTIYDNNGEWYKTDKNEQDYLDKEDEFVKDAINLAASDGIDLSNQDIVIVLHSGTSYQKAYNRIWNRHPKKMWSSTWTPDSQPFGYPPYKIIIAEDDLVGGWTHEIGHIIGALLTLENTMIPELVDMGNIGEWDLMAKGSWNEDANNPPYMSSYTKEFLGWLNYDIYPKSAYGEYWINSLETNNYGDSIFRYNLSDDTNDESPEYYILEARNRNLKTWDSSLPEDKALVLYYVDSKGLPKYGYDLDKKKMIVENWTVTIPSSGLAGVNDGILNPLINETYRDLDNLVKFSAITDRSINNKYEMQARIEEITGDSFSDKFWGVVLRPESIFKKWVKKVFLPNSIKTSEFYEIENNFKEIQLTALFFSQQARKGRIGVPLRISKEEEIREIKVISFGILISIILINLLLILLNKKIFPRWGLEKVQKVIKITIKILWIISIIVLIVSICLLIIVYTAPEPSPKPPGVVKSVPNDNLKSILLPPLEAMTLPDLDLHLYCNDGKHIGMNYGTGEYEVQIPGAIVSGDNQDAPEWIFVPKDITNCHYVVSSYDNQRFLEENPEIAQEISDTTDNYEVYARYIDPETDIYTSATISQEIEAGIQLEHSIIGTDDIAVNPGEITIDSIIGEIYQYFNLSWIDKNGIKESLVFKLSNAKREIEADQKQVAINILNAFINEVEAQKDKHIKVNAAVFLIKNTKEVINHLQR